MNKKSHLLVTEKIIKNIPEKGRTWCLFGSILPDLLLHTYLKGHTWESSFETISRKMQKLEKKGKNSRYSYLMLGYILHYVEDFYTLAHNPVFEGKLPKHVLYENKLEKHLKEKDALLFEKSDVVMSLPMTLSYLQKSHEKYLSKAGDVETDVKYIWKAAEAVSSCLLRAMEVNNIEKESMPTYAFWGYQKMHM